MAARSRVAMASLICSPEADLTMLMYRERVNGQPRADCMSASIVRSARRQRAAVCSQWSHSASNRSIRQHVMFVNYQHTGIPSRVELAPTRWGVARC